VYAGVVKLLVAFRLKDKVEIPKPFLGLSTINIESICEVSWKSKISVDVFDVVLKTLDRLASCRFDAGKFKFSVLGVNVA
jgi:hypothetical protein